MDKQKIKNLKETLNEALSNEPVVESLSSKDFEKQLQTYAKSNNLRVNIKTVGIPSVYDDDIVDYLMEESESIVSDVDANVLKMLKKLGIKDSVKAFIHWVDEDHNYKEYISYAY